jgi:manganese efflux pump family protein
MIEVILLLGVALALDSFAVSASVGAAGLSRSRHLGVSLSFGICDGLASLFGAMLGIGPDASSDQWLHWIGPLAVATYALYVLLLAKLTISTDGSTDARWDARWVVFGLPLCLSLDNFLAGGRLNTLDLPPPVTAMLFGLCSGLLAFAGLRMGERATARWQYQARRAGLLGLFILAVVLAVIQD